jgi:uridylate kinase
MNRAIIKIGGSVLYDENLNFNVELMKKFVDWFEFQREYKSVVFVVGGGKLSRSLVDQVRDEVKQDSSRHQIGIAVTKVNSRIVFGIFNNSKVKYFDCLEKLSNSIKNGNAKGAIIGGLKEGWSTDMVAANIAKALKLKLIFKVSNIDYIYTADPNKRKDAKPLEVLSWEEYIKMFNSQMGKKHKPGMSVPIDIECAKYCKKNNIAFRISGGKLLNKKLEVTELFRSGTFVL